MEFAVVSDWQASYAQPIRLSAGEGFCLTGRREEWDGHVWLWARCAAGLEGWVPDSLVVQGPTGPRAKADYSAVELTCRKAERLTGERETHGWVYCRNRSGAAGWVPRRNLSPVPR